MSDYGSIVLHGVYKGRSCIRWLGGDFLLNRLCLGGELVAEKSFLLLSGEEVPDRIGRSYRSLRTNCRSMTKASGNSKRSRPGTMSAPQANLAAQMGLVMITHKYLGGGWSPRSTTRKAKAN